MRIASVFIVLICLMGQMAAQEKPSVLEQIIKPGKAKKVKALIHITGGELNISRGNHNLAEVNLSYDKNVWSPTVSYAEKDDLGKLIIKASTLGDEKRIDKDNICQISLNDNYYYSLGVFMGAGLADLNFENFKLAKAFFKLGVGSFHINLANTSLPLLKIEAGIGEANLDLSGQYKNDLKAQITAGVGELKIKVPDDIGVKFIVNGFLGNVHAAGYTKEGDAYTNALYGKTRYSIVVKVKGAIGSINVKEINSH